MDKKYYIFTIICLLILCKSCDSVKGNDSSVTIEIQRFDKDLYEWIVTDNASLQKQIELKYDSMLNVLDMAIFKSADTDKDVFFNKVINYYSEPNLNNLYRDALKTFDNVENIEDQLSTAFGNLQNIFPNTTIPVVYMHVSGLQQNILVDDSLLSISIDKYLGADYPLYQDFFYVHQRRKMDPDYIVPDYLTGWLMSEYPFTGDDRVLLDRMIYEGKIKYIIHNVIPQFIPEMLMGYTPNAYQWTKQNVKQIWNIIIERKHLYTPDHVTTSKYFSTAPSTFLSNEAPGEIGTWIGWQIVTRYMDRNQITPEELMANNDFQDILTKSKYRP